MRTRSVAGFVACAAFVLGALPASAGAGVGAAQSTWQCQNGEIRSGAHASVGDKVTGVFKTPPATDGEPPHVITSVTFIIKSHCFSGTVDPQSYFGIGFPGRFPVGFRIWQAAPWTVEVVPLPDGSSKTVRTLAFAGFSGEVNADIRGTIVCRQDGTHSDDMSVAFVVTPR